MSQSASRDAGNRPAWHMAVERAGEGTLLVRLAGSWRIPDRPPTVAAVEEHLQASPRPRGIAFDLSGVTAWDSCLVNFLWRLLKRCAELNVAADRAGLSDGVRRIVDLASAVPPRGQKREERRAPWLARVGASAQAAWEGTREMLVFIGEAIQSLLRLCGGKARFRRSDLAVYLQECGAMGLPIVSLISFLVGLILAFVGAVHLRTFGAQIYAADLVGIGMAREMGAMMTGIIMAGRTGAAFAAQLGTMTVNEEIDALTTMGIRPMDFLVLPRMLALDLMMPLLTIMRTRWGSWAAP